MRRWDDKKFSMNINTETQKQEVLYNLKEVAQILNLPHIGSVNLSWYLKELKIIHPYNIPLQEYLDRGYFVVGYGTRNLRSKRKYSRTLITESGLKWLQEYIFPKIIETEKELNN